MIRPASSGPLGLSGLSDQTLLSRIKTLRHRERSLTLKVVLHLDEIERRRLHLGLGYSSLFNYCLRHLKYSASAAGRRIQTARCIRRFPEVYDLLERGEVNLSTVSLIAPVLSAENKETLLMGIPHKSQREVEMLVAGYRSPVAFRDRVRPVCVAVPRSSGTPSRMVACEKSGYSRSGSGKKPNFAPAGDSVPGNGSANGNASLPATRLERKLHIQFLASEAFMKKYEEASSLLSNRHANGSFETVFESLIDEFLERRSPRRRQERRRAGRKRRAEQNPTNGPATTKVAPKKSAPKNGMFKRKTQPSPGATHERSRHIPAALRDQVFARDGGRCTYVGTTGRRCGSTRHLQIDHLTPFARGGPNNAGNLRVLCAEHNRLDAERSFGTDHMKRFLRRE